MKQLTIFLLLFISNLSYSQNPSYKLFDDSIYPIIDKEYDKAKSLFISLNEAYQVDPIFKKIFCFYALKHDDLDYFKNSMKYLIVNYGYKYSKYDLSLSLIDTSKLTLTKLLKDNNLENWLFDVSDSLYPVWIKNNPRSFEVKQKLNEINTIDQAMRIGFNDLDSLTWDAIMKKDYLNLKTLLQLCDSNGILPNNFDQGIGSSDWFTIYLHNIKSYQTFEIWEEFLPYLERTYLAGKIDNDCFVMYDRILAQFYGVQYFGFLEDVPIKDEEHLLERKEKYGFL